MLSKSVTHIQNTRKIIGEDQGKVKIQSQGETITVCRHVDALYLT